MTPPTSPIHAPSEPENTPRASSDASMLARLDAVQVPLRTHRQRSQNGESFVVIANVPPRTNLVIQVSAARDVHDAARGLAGVTVAVRAMPVLDEEESEATRVFDRMRLPLPVEPISSTVRRTPSCEVHPHEDPRAAQDTLRCAAQEGARPAGAATTTWFAMSAACLVATAVAMFGSLPADGPLPRLEVQTQAAMAPAPSVQTLPVAKPSAKPPAPRAKQPAPSARIELKDLTLDVTSSPWMEVRVDGKSLGNTPRLAVKLSPGSHEIMLVNRDLELETRTVVNAEPDSSETQEIAFE